ncbi:MAG TPA: hypothetical protein VL689_16815 [Paraburkholderia sp.]|jgi:hypothetical protein|nr:hypothetical protein [Paraburkholderia sp.]
MESQRTYEYMGYDMTACVDGDHEHGYFVASQAIQSLFDGTAATNVPVDGVAAGRFPKLDNAFDAAFDRIREEIDTKARAANRSPT